MQTTMIWWSIWGLVMGIGLFGLQEAHRNSVHLIMAIPLLTGAAAAAVVRIKHEYRAAMQNARWMVISAGVFVLGSGYLYLKEAGYGPFATATAHKAFLGSTFGMSLPEVERSIGRKLYNSNMERVSPEGLKEWVLELIPDLDHRAEIRVLPDLVVYRVPCQARFEFVGGKLAKIDVEFQPTAPTETPVLLQRVQEDMDKEYQRAEVPAPGPAGLILYRKESVDASILKTPIDPLHEQLSVQLQYLPLADKKPGSLEVETKAF